jgi:hypothetical protein
VATVAGGASGNGGWRRQWQRWLAALVATVAGGASGNGGWRRQWQRWLEALVATVAGGASGNGGWRRQWQRWLEALVAGGNGSWSYIINRSSTTQWERLHSCWVLEDVLILMRRCGSGPRS